MKTQDTLKCEFQMINKELFSMSPNVACTSGHPKLYLQLSFETLLTGIFMGSIFPESSSVDLRARSGNLHFNMLPCGSHK